MRNQPDMIDISRRHATKLGLTAAALALLPIRPAALAAEAPLNADRSNTAMQSVRFDNHLGISLAGHLHRPVNLDESRTHSAIVVVGPAGGSKEQTAGLYARKLAERGFVAIAFDASFQGESGGQPRYQENPIARVEDVRGAVDHLVSLAFVDEARIGVLGICAGGGYAASAAMTERRIKAVAVSVPVDGGRENRAAGREPTIATLQEIAALRASEAKGAEPTILPWIPDEYRNSPDLDLRQAYDYYRTPRAAHPNWQNKVRFSTMDAVMAFEAFHLSEMLLTQPLQVVVGSEPGAFNSNRDGHDLYKRAASSVKDIVVMEGASHFDLYDNPKYQDPAVATFARFYREHLG